MRKDYYNASAQDIAKRFLRNINLIRAATYVILIVSYFIFVYIVFATPKDYTGFFFGFMFLCVIIIIIRRVHAIIELTMLNLIIDRDCDPVKYTDVFLILREHRWFRKRIGSATLNIAQGYYYSGRFEDAYNTLLELKSVPKQPALALQYHMLMANCGAKLDKPEFVSHAKTEVNGILAAQKPKSGNAKNAKLLLNIIDTTLAEQEKKYDDAIELVNIYQMTVQTPFQKVSATYRLADIYFQMGDYQNAKSRFEFVVQNGNKLFCVDMAQDMLSRCIK